LTQPNDDISESWPVKFCIQRIDLTCENLVRELPDGFTPKRIQYTEPGYNSSGFQLGDSEGGYIQLFVEFNSLGLTLRAIACRHPEPLHCREQAYAIDRADRNTESGRQWDEISASEWIEKMAAESAAILMRTYHG
jgi:hypothetical protein